VEDNVVGAESESRTRGGVFGRISVALAVAAQNAANHRGQILMSGETAF